MYLVIFTSKINVFPFELSIGEQYKSPMTVWLSQKVSTYIKKLEQACQALLKSRHIAGYNPNVPWKWKRRDWEICVQDVMNVRDKYIFYNPWSQSMKDMLLITFSPCSRLLTEMASASNSSCHCSWVQNLNLIQKVLSWTLPYLSPSCQSYLPK